MTEFRVTVPSSEALQAVVDNLFEVDLAGNSLRSDTYLLLGDDTYGLKLRGRNKKNKDKCKLELKVCSDVEGGVEAWSKVLQTNAKVHVDDEQRSLDEESVAKVLHKLDKEMRASEHKSTVLELLQTLSEVVAVHVHKTIEKRVVCVDGRHYVTRDLAKVSVQWVDPEGQTQSREVWSLCLEGVSPGVLQDLASRMDTSVDGCIVGGYPEVLRRLVASETTQETSSSSSSSP